MSVAEAAAARAVTATQSAGAACRICAVVVTYHPDLAVLDTVRAALAGQVAATLVVDNGSSAEVVDWLRACQTATLTLLSLAENTGIAAAHNRGIAWARTQGFTHVLLLDQDSVPAPGLTGHLLRALARLEAQGERVAAVGARYQGSHAGNDSFFVQFGWVKFRSIRCNDREAEQTVPADFLISSGTLIPLAVLDDVGGMEEGLFIDHVDTEWFLRARARGYRAFGACAALMRHGLGEGSYRVWFGRWRHLPRHRPLRHYYIVRNSLLLYRRDYAPPRWIVNDLVRLLFMFVFYSLVQAPRREHARMMLQGLVHGLRGRRGSYTQALAKTT